MRLSTALFLAMGCAANAGDLPAPLTDESFRQPSTQSIALGQLLFYDPVLSGSDTVSCATCHHPRFGTSDGLSLGLGDGGTGLGPERVVDRENLPEKRVPRNSPALFNLGAYEFTSLFHDGRLEADPSKPAGIRTPLGQEMVAGFQSVLAAQAMFPVLSPDEMAGHYSESAISRAVRQGRLTHSGGAWSLIAQKVRAIPQYRALFDRVNGVGSQIDFTDIANAIADFVAFEFRADDSPFDRHLRGTQLLPGPAQQGMALFYGKAGCSTCHAGPFQTDHAFHAIAMVQIGPGKAERFESHNRDDGRFRVTGRAQDAFRFRTPSLRNIALTAPYGHDGAYASLEAVLRHHLDPVRALLSYDPSQAILPDLPGAQDWNILRDAGEISAIAAANELEPMSLTDGEVALLITFLNSLTDRTGVTGRLGVPRRVPSGLPLD